MSAAGPGRPGWPGVGGHGVADRAQRRYGAGVPALVGIGQSAPRPGPEAGIRTHARHHAVHAVRGRGLLDRIEGRVRVAIRDFNPNRPLAPNPCGDRERMDVATCTFFCVRCHIHTHGGGSSFERTPGPPGRRACASRLTTRASGWVRAEPLRHRGHLTVGGWPPASSSRPRRIGTPASSTRISRGLVNSSRSGPEMK